MLNWRRWWFVLIPLVATCWVVGDDLVTRAINSHFQVNAWDLDLEMVNNVAILVFVLVPLAALVVGQVAVQDRLDGFIALAYPRIRSRWRWWTAKVVAFAAATVAFFLMTLTVGYLIGWALTGHASASLSEYGQAGPDTFGAAAEAARYYGPPPLPAAAAVVRVSIEYLYTAIAAWAFLSLCMAAAARYARAWVPIVATVLIIGVSSQLTPTTIAHPLVHLIWDYHTFSITDTAVTWWASGLVIVIELALAVGIGGLLANRTDLLRGQP